MTWQALSARPWQQEELNDELALEKLLAAKSRKAEQDFIDATSGRDRRILLATSSLLLFLLLLRPPPWLSSSLLFLPPPPPPPSHSCFCSSSCSSSSFSSFSSCSSSFLLLQYILHITWLYLTRETRVQYAPDDVASTICQALSSGHAARETQTAAEGRKAEVDLFTAAVKDADHSATYETAKRVVDRAQEVSELKYKAGRCRLLTLGWPRLLRNSSPGVTASELDTVILNSAGFRSANSNRGGVDTT